jgi:uroporphyrinogen decarboxylase
MTKRQWDLLLDIINGKIPESPVAGFIIDSPWLPGWAGISALQYYSSEEKWFQANKKAIETFPDVMFLPGFWSEFGMCTEPSAFGAKPVWNESSLPHAEQLFRTLGDTKNLKIPNPKTDGLLPFIIQRLVNYQTPIRQMGHEIKFAVARGPLNIASFLLGTNEFMMGLMIDPEQSHRFLETITQFTIDWVQHQKEMFPTIEGILLLDDIVGFVGADECQQFAVPYIKRIFSCIDSKINFFHNDANGLSSTPFLNEMGVNLFNFSFEHSMSEIRKLAGNKVALIGNLPPRDVLALGNKQRVIDETKIMMTDFPYEDHVVWSCGGGMPQNVSSENILAFLETVKNN